MRALAYAMAIVCGVAAGCLAGLIFAFATCTVATAANAPDIGLALGMLAAPVFVITGGLTGYSFIHSRTGRPRPPGPEA